MELNELKTMWQSYEKKLDKTLKLNQHFIEMIQVQKVKSEISPLLWQRIIEIGFHTIAIILLSAFFTKNFYEFPYAASAFLLISFYAIAFTSCLKQIRIIKQMDYGNDVVSIQSSLVMLRTNILNYVRLTVLCLPTLLAYPVVVPKAFQQLNITFLGNFDIIEKSNGNWWTAQIFASIVLIPLGIWIYRQVTYKNIHKAWVRDFIQASAGIRVRKSIEFLNELESLKHDII